MDTLKDKEMKIPERMCICCRKKGEKPEFFRIAEQDGKYVFDKEMKIQARGFYVCIDILKPMKNSEYFVFGIDETIDGIKREKIKLVVIPKDIKTKYIEEFKKLSEEFNFKIVFIEKKAELIELFSRDVNVVGIFDKKVIKGILSKVEVMNG